MGNCGRFYVILLPRLHKQFSLCSLLRDREIIGRVERLYAFFLVFTCRCSIGFGGQVTFLAVISLPYDFHHVLSSRAITYFCSWANRQMDPLLRFALSLSDRD